MVLSNRSLALRAVQSFRPIAPRHSNPRYVHHYVPRGRNPGTASFSHAQPCSHSSLRLISTSHEVAGDARPLTTRLKNLLLGTTIGLALVFAYYYITDTRAGIHQWLVVPSLRWMYNDAEEAHEAGTKALKGLYEFGIHPRERGNPDTRGDLHVEVFGHTLVNPIGTSAGIDKHGEIPDPLLALGCAVIEVGGATPYPQDGNPKPRVFRLPSQKALINRYGLNSQGADDLAMRFRQRVREYAYSIGFGIDEEAEQRVLDGEAGVPPGSLVPGKLMAVQVAKNKFTPDHDIEAVKRDYVYCVEVLARYADIIVVNVSSPNTPGLRALQNVEPLTNILTGVVEAAKKANRKTQPVVMVKVSPDEDSDEQVSGICHAVAESGVEGVIVANSTKNRPDPLPAGYSLSGREAALMLEQGGYSGPQLFDRTVALVRRYRKSLDEGAEPKSIPPPVSATEAPKIKERPESERDSISQEEPGHVVADRIEATIKRDSENLKPPSQDAATESQTQPLIRLPARNNPFSPETASSSPAPALSSSTHIEQLPPTPTVTPPSTAPTDPPISLGLTDTSPLPIPLLKQAPALTPSRPERPAQQRKVIFATGGITNGKQALEVLDAGADIAQVYTALVYGGVGTISRIKGEMREEIAKRKSGNGW